MKRSGLAWLPEESESLSVDVFWMTEALKEARLAASKGEVPVGAVVVQGKRVLGRGHNSPLSFCDPTAHAEVLALRAAARTLGNYRLLQAVLYSTLEPCLMCMGALLHARVERLVFGCNDPRGGAAGSLYNLAEDKRLNHRIEVRGGVCEAECRSLLQDFFRAKRLREKKGGGVMRVNKLKQTLKAGGVALGTLLWEVKGRGVLHTLAAAGMDFVMICTEHSAYDLETVVDMVAHAHAAGLTPVVRIPALEYPYVTRLLDTGCQSLIVPHVETGEQVQRILEFAKYHPQGKRGMAIYLGASTDYEEVDIPTAIEHANAHTLIGVLTETEKAIENLEEILVEGVDLALVGHQDLAQSLGVPGQVQHPRVQEATERVRALCRERGIAMAGAVARPEDIPAVVQSGAQFLLYGTDLVLLRREAQRAVQALGSLR